MSFLAEKRAITQKEQEEKDYELKYRCLSQWYNDCCAALLLFVVVTAAPRRSIERCQRFSNLAAATLAQSGNFSRARGEGRKLRCPIRNRGRPQKERTEKKKKESRGSEEGGSE